MSVNNTGSIPDDPTWKPVQFNCMIQDILGNEIYSNEDDDDVAAAAAAAAAAANVSEQTKHNFKDRTIYYCISVPGKNDWIKDDRNELPESMSDYPNSTDNDRLSLSLVNRSFPIKSGRNRSCLIKIYDMNLVDRLRVNDIVHVSGLVEPKEFEDGSELVTNGELSGFEPAADFPFWLVPRVHVKSLKKITHINPLLPEVIKRNELDLQKIKLAKTELKDAFKVLFGGDDLAAEYLTLSLISRIYRRKDITTLGQLSLNILGFKPSMGFLIDKLYEIITKITTHSHLIDLSIANLNNLRFIPEKDYDNNKMIAGTLQLPDGLYLVLNETALGQGQLTAEGTANIGALNQVIRWQQMNFDFKFHSANIDTDLKLLVLSEGKSILSVPYCVKLNTSDADVLNTMREACGFVTSKYFLNDDRLNLFRYYITALKEVPEYTIPDDITKLITDNYSEWRQQDSKEGRPLFSADDLSSYITVARYLTVSRGEFTLTKEVWEEACQLESGRRARLEHSG